MLPRCHFRRADADILRCRCHADAVIVCRVIDELIDIFATMLLMMLTLIADAAALMIRYATDVERYADALPYY